ncbi:MAG: TlpA family protein disulfide reductase [Gaiellaceae bacterium]
MRPLGLALVVALCALVTVGCGGGSTEPAAAPDAPPAETKPTTSFPRVPAPTVAGTSIDGKPLSLADYRGQAVLINVWSSW